MSDTAQSWPIDPEEIARHDEQFSREWERRQQQGTQQ